jgi:hypothetical protein
VEGLDRARSSYSLTAPEVCDMADSAPAVMDHHEKMKIRAAAFRATRLYPGPVGELLSRELLSFEEFGYRLAKDGLVMRLVDHIMKATIETKTPVASTTGPLMAGFVRSKTAS